MRARSRDGDIALQRERIDDEIANAHRAHNGEGLHASHHGSRANETEQTKAVIAVQVGDQRQVDLTVNITTETSEGDKLLE